MRPNEIPMDKRYRAVVTDQCVVEGKYGAIVLLTLAVDVNDESVPNVQMYMQITDENGDAGRLFDTTIAQLRFMGYEGYDFEELNPGHSRFHKLVGWTGEFYCGMRASGKPYWAVNMPRAEGSGGGQRFNQPISTSRAKALNKLFGAAAKDSPPKQKAVDDIPF